MSDSTTPQTSDNTTPDITPSLVTNTLTKRGKPKRLAPHAYKIDWLAARADYLTGLTAKELSARYHIPVSAFEKRITREGWNKERQNMMARVEARTEATIAEITIDMRKRVGDICREKITSLNEMPTQTLRTHVEFSRALESLTRTLWKVSGLDQAGRGSPQAVAVSINLGREPIPLPGAPPQVTIIETPVESVPDNQ